MYKNYMYSDTFEQINKLGKALARMGYKIKVKRTSTGFCMEANASADTLKKTKELLF